MQATRCVPRVPLFSNVDTVSAFLDLKGRRRAGIIPSETDMGINLDPCYKERVKGTGKCVPVIPNVVGQTGSLL